MRSLPYDLTNIISLSDYNIKTCLINEVEDFRNIGGGGLLYLQIKAGRAII